MIVPVLFLLAIAGIIYSSARGVYRRSFSIFTIAATSSLIGVFAIAFILTLLKITSYTEIERAMHSAYAMVLVFIVMTGLEMLCIYSDRKNSSC